MSYTFAVPDVLSATAEDLAGIGSSLGDAHAAAAPTTAVAAAAEDEVSTAIASLFSDHGQAFQALSARAAAFHTEFVQALSGGAAGYAGAESANAGLVQASSSLNVSMSVSGFKLVQLGSANATSGSGNFAIAVGANSAAVSGAGIYKEGFFNVAAAYGQNSTAIAGAGSGNVATVIGAGSKATVGVGNFNRGFIFGADSFTTNGQGNLNAGFIFGSNDVAISGGSAAGHIPGSFDYASVIGTGSTASSGSSLSAAGNACLASALGDSNNARATGANFLIDIAPNLFQ